MARERKVLFDRSSPCIQPLRALVERQTHKTLVVWALDSAPRVLALFEAAHPEDPRPRRALEAGWAWAHGEIKMPEAKRAILAAHAAGGEAGSPVAEAAARAMGHAAATVHAETHALGLVFYGLTGFVRAAPEEDPAALAERECDWFCRQLVYWQDHIDQAGGRWAPFLLQNAPNKERLWHERAQAKAQDQTQTQAQSGGTG